MQHKHLEPGKEGQYPRFSPDFIKKCRKIAKDYDSKFNEKLTKMLTYSEENKNNTCLDSIIEADKTFCELMLEAMHDEKMPSYVIKFYSEIYNSVRHVLDKKDYVGAKYLREFLK
jgi:hypothetical protein